MSLMRLNHQLILNLSCLMLSFLFQLVRPCKVQFFCFPLWGFCIKDIPTCKLLLTYKRFHILMVSKQVCCRLYTAYFCTFPLGSNLHQFFSNQECLYLLRTSWLLFDQLRICLEVKNSQTSHRYYQAWFSSKLLII